MPGMAAAMPTLRVSSIRMWLERSTRAPTVWRPLNSLRSRSDSAAAMRAGGSGADIEAKGLLGGDPARRGVGLGEVAFVGQIRHHVADRGRAQGLAAALGDGARPHRLSGLDVGADNRIQDFLMSAF